MTEYTTYVDLMERDTLWLPNHSSKLAELLDGVCNVDYHLRYPYNVVNLLLGESCIWPVWMLILLLRGAGVGAAAYLIGCGCATNAPTEGARCPCCARLGVACACLPCVAICTTSVGLVAEVVLWLVLSALEYWWEPVKLVQYYLWSISEAVALLSLLTMLVVLVMIGVINVKDLATTKKVDRSSPVTRRENASSSEDHHAATATNKAQDASNKNKDKDKNKNKNKSKKTKKKEE